MPRKKDTQETEAPPTSEPEPDEPEEGQPEGPWGDDDERDVPKIIKLRVAMLSTVQLQAAKDGSHVLKLAFHLSSSQADSGFDLLSPLWKNEVDLVVIPLPLRANDVPEDQLRLGEDAG